jgi:tetratricopeptide (TPR) repeat protein/tRNA A-37 threonylcarbamoyl transferase component Bud32
MATLLTCPRGHRFDLSLDDAEPSTRFACPVCGVLCSPATATLTVPERAMAPQAQLPGPGGPISGAVPGYEILEKLGQGGMGVVFKARQTKLNRVVALKMILGSHHANAQQLARFQVEAEALASLQHPHIVQVHEVGTHDGSPYFSMEFVEGGSLDQKLAGRPQAPRDAAGMVELLARAIHAAHLRGIIHRDLKPVNVLLAPGASGSDGSGVQGLGSPKIADFGLAKRLEAEDDRTLPGVVMGTPSYMAPEQAEGKSREIGPATDVHALGVILYEMLTGKTPFDGPTAYATLENVKHVEAVAPSKHQPGVPRDLDIICLKCLHKTPSRRYATAEALADDLRRFLNNEPILARPVGRAERLLKWVQRRPTAATLVFVLLLGSLTALAAGIWHHVRLRSERDRAEKNFQTALDAVNKMLTVVGEEQLASEPGMTQKRRELLEEALKYYQKLLAEKQDDPAMRRHVAQAHKRVGDIHRLLREQEKADASYLAAIGMLKVLVAEYPDDPELRQHLADSHNWRGELLRQANKIPEAEAAYNEALKIQSDLTRDFPQRPEFEQDLARSHYNLGLLFKDSSQLSKAQDELHEAVARLRKLADADPNRPTNQEHLGRAYLNQATVLHLLGKAHLEALDAAARAMVLFRNLSRKYPQVPDYRWELAISCNNLGNMVGSFEQAEKYHREAIAELQKLAADFSSIPDYRSELANTCNSLASGLASNKRPNEAKVLWDHAEELQQRLVEQFPKVATYRGDLGMTRASLGKLALNQQDPALARKYLLASTVDLEEALKANPNHPDYLAAAWFAYRALAVALTELGEDQEALERATHLVEAFPHRDKGLLLALRFLARCGEVLKIQVNADPARTAGVAKHAEQIVRTASEAGRTKALEVVRDDAECGWLRGQPGVVALLPGKGSK